MAMALAEKMDSSDSWVTSMLDVEFDNETAEEPPAISRAENSIQGDLVMGLDSLLHIAALILLLICTTDYLIQVIKRQKTGEVVQDAF